MNARQTNAATGDSTNTPNPRQPIQWTNETSFQSNNAVRQINIEDDLQTCTTRRTSTEHGQKVYSNIQRPFRWDL
jgi:hypothetical protein